jgi:hypothetical protein
MRRGLVVLVRPFYRPEVRRGGGLVGDDLKSAASAVSLPPFCKEDATGSRFWEGKGTGLGGAWSHAEEGSWMAQRGGARPTAAGGGG